MLKIIICGLNGRTFVIILNLILSFQTQQHNGKDFLHGDWPE